MSSDLFENALQNLKRSARDLGNLTTAEKDSVLNEVAQSLIQASSEILESNQKDLARLPADAVPAFRDRLTLNSARIQAMAESIQAVAKLEDPVFELIEKRELQNGLQLKKIRSPLGVILMIFESRPNVITEVFSLAFKSGNAITLRGGSESKETAQVIYRLIKNILQKKFSARALPFLAVEDYDRNLVGKLLQRDDLFDVCIPRGGDQLIARVKSEAKMPIIKNDRGMCHLYIHHNADLKMAAAIAVNAKTQRPGVCNAIETLLLDRKIAQDALKEIAPALADKNVGFKVCNESAEILKNLNQKFSLATAEDFDREHLDLIMNIRIVENLDEALAHIAEHGSKHSEAIITSDEISARRFQHEIDAACVYWNASTRFTDGFEFGLGGEIGISTQKLHVRGPVGLRELTSARWVIDGTGQVRN